MTGTMREVRVVIRERQTHAVTWWGEVLCGDTSGRTRSNDVRDEHLYLADFREVTCLNCQRMEGRAASIPTQRRSDLVLPPASAGRLFDRNGKERRPHPDFQRAAQRLASGWEGPPPPRHPRLHQLGETVLGILFIPTLLATLLVMTAPLPLVASLATGDFEMAAWSAGAFAVGWGANWLLHGRFRWWKDL